MQDPYMGISRTVQSWVGHGGLTGRSKVTEQPHRVKGVWHVTIDAREVNANHDWLIMGTKGAGEQWRIVVKNARLKSTASAIARKGVPGLKIDTVDDMRESVTTEARWTSNTGPRRPGENARRADKRRGPIAVIRSFVVSMTSDDEIRALDAVEALKSQLTPADAKTLRMAIRATERGEQGDDDVADVSRILRKLGTVKEGAVKNSSRSQESRKHGCARLVESSTDLVERMKADPELENYMDEALTELEYGDYALSDASMFVIGCLEEQHGEDPDWREASLDMGVWVEDELRERMRR